MHPAAASTHSTSIGNTLEELGSLYGWVSDIARGHRLSHEASFKIDLCLNEAVENVIRHAFDDQAWHPIRIRLDVEQPCVNARLEYGGRPFDPLTLPAPAVPRSVEEAIIGGLGAHLMRHFSDQMGYSRSGDTNVLTIVWNIPAHAKGAALPEVA